MESLMKLNVSTNDLDIFAENKVTLNGQLQVDTKSRELTKVSDLTLQYLGFSLDGIARFRDNYTHATPSLSDFSAPLDAGGLGVGPADVKFIQAHLYRVHGNVLSEKIALSNIDLQNVLE